MPGEGHVHFLSWGPDDLAEHVRVDQSSSFIFSMNYTDHKIVSPTPQPPDRAIVFSLDRQVALHAVGIWWGALKGLDQSSWDVVCMWVDGGGSIFYLGGLQDTLLTAMIH